MSSRLTSFLYRVSTRLSVGAKLALLLTVVAATAGSFVGWRVYETQSDQIRKDFEQRALLVLGAVQAATASQVTPTSDAERLQQLIEQQNYIEGLISREPSISRINVYAENEGQILIIGSSERELLGTAGEDEQHDFAAVSAGAVLTDERALNGKNVYELLVPLEIDGQPPLAIGVYLSTAERDDALIAVQRAFGVTVAVSIVAAIAVLYGFTWLLVARRLQRLARAAERMRRGEYSTRVSGAASPDARDEIARLSADFNTMAQAIEELHTETSGLASTDPLTGLYNRRFFLESLQREMERSRRDGRPLAAVMLDLDGFKAVNDRHGHTVGDAALMHIGRALQSAARAGDVTARFGGDEFVALLPNCDAASLEGVMERIRRHIAELAPPRAGDGEALHVTVSAGGALLRGDDTVDSLMQRADLALFEAKNNGRNQVRLAA